MQMEWTSIICRLKCTYQDLKQKSEISEKLKKNDWIPHNSEDQILSQNEINLVFYLKALFSITTFL